SINLDFSLKRLTRTFPYEKKYTIQIPPKSTTVHDELQVRVQVQVHLRFSIKINKIQEAPPGTTTNQPGKMGKTSNRKHGIALCRKKAMMAASGEQEHEHQELGNIQTQPSSSSSSSREAPEARSQQNAAPRPEQPPDVDEEVWEIAKGKKKTFPSTAVSYERIVAKAKQNGKTNLAVHDNGESIAHADGCCEETTTARICEDMERMKREVKPIADEILAHLPDGYQHCFIHDSDPTNPNPSTNGGTTTTMKKPMPEYALEFIALGLGSLSQNRSAQWQTALLANVVDQVGSVVGSVNSKLWYKDGKIPVTLYDPAMTAMDEKILAESGFFGSSWKIGTEAAIRDAFLPGLLGAQNDHEMNGGGLLRMNNDEENNLSHDMPFFRSEAAQEQMQLQCGKRTKKYLIFYMPLCVRDVYIDILRRVEAEICLNKYRGRDDTSDEEVKNEVVVACVIGNDMVEWGLMNKHEGQDEEEEGDEQVVDPADPYPYDCAADYAQVFPEMVEQQNRER
ncbi:unnamed protein product, partial [Amoebophrya sp. A120]